MITDTSNPKYDQLIVISDDILKEGNIIKNSKIPFTIEVIDYIMNCEEAPR